MRTRSEARRAREREREEEREQAPEWQIDVPSDPINEQVILAAMAADDEVRERLVRYPADAFSVQDHRVIFVGMQELARRKLAYDPATLARLNPEIDIRILEQFAARPDTPPNLEFHERTLLWDHRRAQAARGPIARMLEALVDPKETPDRMIALARAVGEAFDRAEGSGRFLRKPGDVVAEMMKKVRARVAGEALYPFGIPGLDLWEEGATNHKKQDIGGTPRIIPGAAPGLATMLTGMSGAGKTTLSAHAILGIARQKRRVTVGAWEVRAPMTLELLTVLSLGWSRARILNGKSNRFDGPMSPADLAIFEERAHEISKWVTFIDNPFQRGAVTPTGRRATNEDYLKVLEEHLELSGCEVGVFDLFDRVLRDRAPNDEQEAIWWLLEVIERLQIHGIVVHQQLLKGEGVRKDMKPNIQGLKGSTAYVDAAALILAPHLPARWKKVPDDKIEVYGLKQRYGPPFAVEFGWDPDTGRIWGGTSMEIDSRDDDGNDDAFVKPRGAGKGRR